MAPPGPSDADSRAAWLTAVQTAVDRVTSWQEGAPVETIRSELEDALSKSGVVVPDSFVDRVVQHVHAGGEHVDVEHFLD